MSGLGLSSCSASSTASEGAEASSRPPAGMADGLQLVPWERPPLSGRAKWRRRHDPAAQPQRVPPRFSPSREVSPEMVGLCFRCFQDGHYRKDCTNDIVCFRCGLSGHGSRVCKRPLQPVVARGASEACRQEGGSRGMGSAPASRGSGGALAGALLRSRRRPLRLPRCHRSGPASPRRLRSGLATRCRDRCCLWTRSLTRLSSAWCAAPSPWRGWKAGCSYPWWHTRRALGMISRWSSFLRCCRSRCA